MSLYKTALQNLEAAKKLIRNERRWIQGALAQKRDVDGELGPECSPRSKNAQAFCALGAVRHVNGPGEKKANELLRQAAFLIVKKDGAETSNKPSNDDIFTINDDYGHKATLGLFARAIRLAKQA